jgi:hypothetical protein
MTLGQIEGNEEIHENWGTELGEEIDEVWLQQFDPALLHSIT